MYYFIEFVINRNIFSSGMETTTNMEQQYDFFEKYAHTHIHINTLILFRNQNGIYDRILNLTYDVVYH